MAFRGEDITEDEIKKLEPIVGDEGFTVENMKSKSAAAANLCSWVISIYTYNRIYVKVRETSCLPDRLHSRSSSHKCQESHISNRFDPQALGDVYNTHLFNSELPHQHSSILELPKLPVAIVSVHSHII